MSAVLSSRPAPSPAPPTTRKQPAALPMPFEPAFRSAGEIVGRPDLSDEAVLAAVAERLGFENRDPKQARVVLDAALAGKQIAVNFLRSLALPMPEASLAMPEQPLLTREA